jgi:hypothetical protein
LSAVRARINSELAPLCRDFTRWYVVRLVISDLGSDHNHRAATTTTATSSHKADKVHSSRRSRIARGRMKCKRPSSRSSVLTVVSSSRSAFAMVVNCLSEGHR